MIEMLKGRYEVEAYMLAAVVGGAAPWLAVGYVCAATMYAAYIITGS